MTRNKAKRKIQQAQMIALTLGKRVKSRLPKLSTKRKNAIFDEVVIRTAVITAVTILIRAGNKIKR